jgi:hypothetical protein
MIPTAVMTASRISECRDGVRLYDSCGRSCAVAHREHLFESFDIWLGADGRP